MINTIASHILGLPAWLALVVVFLLPALESSVFLGFVFPGEIALILGGVLASQGRVSLVAVLGAGILGAIIGDSVGYLVGRRYGRRLIDGTLGRFIPHHHVDRAEKYLAERGGRAVFFGRFTASLRAMIPGLAGMSRMSYRRFVGFNVAGGAIWGAYTVILGFLGGSSWQHVAHLASRIGLAALGLFVLALAGGWLLRHTRLARRWPGSFATAWVGTGRALAGTRLGRSATGRFPKQVAFVGRRLDPYSPVGLPATTLLLIAVVCVWTFGGLTQDVTAHEGLALSDPSVHAWVLAHRTGWLNAVMKAVTWVGSNTVLVPALVVAVLLLRRLRGSWWPALQLVVIYGAAVLGHAVVAETVQRARPPAADWLAAASGWSYTSGHATQISAFCGGLLLVVVPAVSHRLRAVAIASGVVIVCLVGASRVYLGVHWLTDVLGGFMMSTTLVCLVGLVVLGRAGRRREPDEGATASSPGEHASLKGA